MSSGLVRYAARFGSGAPGMRSMRCSMPRSGGRPGGSSSGNTSSNSYKRDIKDGGMFVNVLVVSLGPLHMST